MALKCIINDLSDVAAHLRDHYRKAADGRFTLVLDGEPVGYVTAGKLDEFRSNNRTLHAAKTQLEEQLKAFEGIDPAKLTEQRQADIDAAVAAAKAELAAQHASELAARDNQKASTEAELQSALNSERAAHAATQLKHMVGYDFLRLGGRPAALDYVVSKASQVFAVEDGKLTTKEFSPTTPGESLSLTEWIQQQATEANFLFRPSTGGGAVGSSMIPVGRRTVSAMDPIEIGRNLAEIAKGDVTLA